MTEPKRNWRIKERPGQPPVRSNLTAQNLSLAARGFGTPEMVRATSPEVQRDLVLNPEKYMKK